MSNGSVMPGKRLFHVPVEKQYDSYTVDGKPLEWSGTGEVAGLRRALHQIRRFVFGHDFPLTIKDDSRCLRFLVRVFMGRLLCGFSEKAV